MNETMGGGRRYLGIRPGDLANQPYARFWNPVLAPLPAHVLQAVAHGPVAEPLLPALSEIERLSEGDPWLLENGYGLARGGAAHVAVSTSMPEVSPEMIDWWFGWHSDEPLRYKLWHPRAHVHAAWQSPAPAGAQGARQHYLGRTSCVDEYLGSQLGSYAIHFLPPETLGLAGQRYADAQQATAICARVGFAQYPLDIGYLAHLVERTDQGSVMRSRFWIGGPYAGPRRGGPLARGAVALVKRVLKPRPHDALALLVHCSQEMSHLASFLPELYRALGP